MVRRRQRLSRSCTAPDERSAATSRRAMSLRISTGRSNCADGLALARREGEARIAERQALEIEGANDAVVAAARWPERRTLTLSAPAVFSAPASARAGSIPPSTTVIGRAAGGARETVDELVGAPEVDAVGEPEQLDVGGRGEEAADHRRAPRRARSYAASAGSARAARATEPGVSSEMSRAGLRQRHDGDAGLVGLGARDQVLGGTDAPVPGRRRRPAVVDHQHERRDAADEVAIGGFHNGPAAARISSAARRQPQQQQPPWGARRRLLLRRDVEQEARRREVDAARARRDQPQAATTAPAG